MRETEITVQVLEKNWKNKLEEQGFSIVEKFQLNDYYYSRFSIEELKSFTYENILRNSFIVRNVIDDNNITKIMFKDKALDNCGNVVSEEKIQTKVEDLNKTLKIFDMAGINKWCCLRQESSVYKKGKIVFVVQEVEGLGVFIEYEEDENITGTTEQEKMTQMFETLKSLNLKLGNDISCKKVYLKFLKENK